MSEEQKEKSTTPAKPEAPAAPAKEAPPPPPLGVFGQQLEAAGMAVTPQAADADGMEVIAVAPGDVLRAATYLRDQAQFDLLLSCSGVDWKDRLESVYHLYSTKTHQSLALKVTAINEQSPSLTPVYPAAGWHEREAYDLLGIHYDGHPNLTRILMPNDWLGHPLRKGYKVDDPRLVWNER